MVGVLKVLMAIIAAWVLGDELTIMVEAEAIRVGLEGQSLS